MDERAKFGLIDLTGQRKWTDILTIVRAAGADASPPPPQPGVRVTEEPPAVVLLRGPLSARATSAEFNEWQAREVVAHIDALTASIPDSGEGWQDIATAPKEGPAYLVHCPERQNTYVVLWDRWDGTGWLLFGGGSRSPLNETPSHWRPLPPDPPASP